MHLFGPGRSLSLAVPDFELLTPFAVQGAVEGRFGLGLDGSLRPYNSYVNRVYGLRDDGGEFIAKFYRPGRWSAAALEEEHQFLQDCVAADLPVAAPLVDPDGETLGEVEIQGPHGATTYFFALFPKKGGRTFDAESAEDWLRLGRLLGRLHQVGRQKAAPHRPVCTPAGTTARQVADLLASGVVHPDLEKEFSDLCSEVLKRLPDLFRDQPLQRIHGDVHRGNILDRPGEGLLLMDFDDMMTGPPVQDLWLLIPGHREDCGRELGLLAEGYEDFGFWDPGWWDLVEPLRFMRMIHFLAWAARQRGDRGFQNTFSDWGTKGFWVREVEDLRLQAERF